jgi:hypothetical protein
MKIGFAKYLAAVCLTTVSLATAGVAAPAITTPEADKTIVPGVGIGYVRLGMNRDQITRTLGKRDGSYVLPGKIKVEYSEWKDPERTVKIRVFFNEKGHVIQLVSEAAPVPSTVDGISIASTLADVNKKYKQLQRFKYQSGANNIDYYDDISRGIAFKFAGTDLNARTDKTLDAIIVHPKGTRFIADAKERRAN